MTSRTPRVYARRGRLADRYERHANVVRAAQVLPVRRCLDGWKRSRPPPSRCWSTVKPRSTTIARALLAAQRRSRREAKTYSGRYRSPTGPRAKGGSDPVGADAQRLPADARMRRAGPSLTSAPSRPTAPSVRPRPPRKTANSAELWRQAGNECRPAALRSQADRLPNRLQVSPERYAGSA